MTVGLLVAGLATGLVSAPASASASGPPSIGESESPAAQARPHAKAKGAANLRISAISGGEVPTALTRATATGVVRRKGRVVGRLAIPMRVVADTPGLPSHWRGRLAVRSLVPGRYRVNLTSISADTTVPGGRVPPADLHEFRLARVAPLKVRANRTTTWRTKYGFNDFDLVVSGKVVDPQGRPIDDLPICRVAHTRFARGQQCGTSRSDGRFTLRLRPVMDIYLEWERLQFGDSLLDLPWRTVIQMPAEITRTTIRMQPRGAVTGLVTGPAGRALAGQSVCAAPMEPAVSGTIYGFWAEKAWCTGTDASGQYSLRVDGGEQVFLPSDPTSQGFVERMDTYLASDEAEPLWLRDVGWPNAAPGQIRVGESYRDMIAQPGRRLDLALTALVPGADIRVSGQLTRVPVPGTTEGDLAGDSVCGYSRAGFACADTDSTGRYELALPTRVSPDDPTGPATVKIVATPRYFAWRPTVERFTASPGTSLTRNLHLQPYN